MGYLISLPRYFFGDVASVLGCTFDVLEYFISQNGVGNVRFVDEHLENNEEKARLWVNMAVVVVKSFFKTLYPTHALLEVVDFYLDPETNIFVFSTDTLNSFLERLIQSESFVSYKGRSWYINTLKTLYTEKLHWVPTTQHLTSIFGIMQKENSQSTLIPYYSIFVPAKLLEFNSANFLEETATLIRLLGYLYALDKNFTIVDLSIDKYESQLGDFGDYGDCFFDACIKCCLHMDMQERAFYQQYLIPKGFKFA